MSWLYGWDYRKRHDINPASGAGTDYQIKITVRYHGTLTFVTNFVKSPNNPLKDLDGGYWITGFYNNYDGRIYLLVQPTYTGSSIQCFSFTPENWDNPANWTDHGLIYTDTNYTTLEPHSVIFETQAMADARTGVPNSERKWRLYYAGGASGSDLSKPVSFAVASETSPTSWTKYGRVYGYGTSYHGTSCICDPQAFIKDGKVWMAVKSYLGDRVGEQWFAKSDNGINGWVDTFNNLESYTPVWGTDYPVTGGISWISNFPAGSSTFFSPDGEYVIPYSGNPVMPPGGAGAWDEHLADMTIIKDKNENIWIDGYVYLYYYGRLSDDTNPKIGAARSNTTAQQPATDSGGNVFLFEKCKTDFGDVRFTRVDGSTLLSYWMESKVDSDNAVFWVKIPDDLSTNPATIYLYYGNPSATTTSNGVNTFVFFDDFEAGLDNWTLYGTTSHIVQSTEYVYQGTYSCKDADTVGTYAYAVRTFVARDKGRIMVWFYDNGAGKQQMTVVDNGTTIVLIGRLDDRSSSFYVYRIGDTFYVSSMPVSIGWHKFEFIYGTGSKVVLKIDGTQIYSGTPVASYSRMMFGDMWYGYGYDSPGYYDCWAEAKFVDPEPTHGAWGSEELLAVTVTRFIGDGLAGAVVMV